MDLSSKHCNNCKKIITSKFAKIFCGRSCAASFNNKMFQKRKKIKKQCKVCGQLVDINENTHCRDCINKKCYFAKVVDVEVAKTDRTRRLLLIKDDGAKCSICKNTEWNGKEIPLELEHIDGDSGNNSRENLSLICPNCHAQTDTYKGKNKGKGRYTRMKRYHSGKSF